MARIERPREPLSVNPLKASQPIGGTLATLGFRAAMPLLHGAQGCTAFGKVYFVRHFNEPVPLQTTAIDSMSAVLGADDHATQALARICEKSRPALIPVMTTGLAEAEGTDIQRLVKAFRHAHPEHADTAVVPVSTPDFSGSMESGYATTLAAIIEHLVPDARTAGTRPGSAPQQVNLLLSSAVSPGDAEALAELTEAFGLEPVLIPDLSASMDGHLADGDFSPVTTDGTPIEALARCGNATATLVVGASLHQAADRLSERTGVPDYRFDHVMGLHATDRLVTALGEIAGRERPPARVQRHRRQLQDALLDTHTVLGGTRIGIAADADLLHGLGTLLTDSGAELATAVTPASTPVCKRIPADAVYIGDLQALEIEGRAAGIELILGSGHAVATAERLGVPILQCGYPIWERLGLQMRPRVGYRGSRDTLFEVANRLLDHREHTAGAPPYRSVFRPTESPHDVHHAHT